MQDWKIVEIDSVCNKIVDCLNRTAPKVDYETPYKMIRTSNVRHGRVNLESVFYVDMNTFKKWTRRLTPIKNDIILTREAPLGEIGILKTNETVFLGQRTVLYRVEESVCNAHFLYYSLLAPYCQANIKAYGSGSTVEHMRVPDSKKIKLKLPPLPTQKKIASILSAYDDLIENNLKRIKLLEEKAQKTYEQWFVRMQFPGHETTPINAGTGLPEGWCSKRLDEVAKINANSIKKGFNEKIEYIDIASVSPGQINKTTSFEFTDAPGRAKRIMLHGDIIWSCVRPNRKSYAYIWNPENNLIASTGFCVISPKSLPTSYLLQFVTTDSFVGYLNNRAGGAAYPAVKAIDFKEAKVVVPSTEMVNKYNNVFGGNLELKWALQEQNHYLKEARDILLPRLMTGMVDVDKLDAKNQRQEK